MKRTVRNGKLSKSLLIELYRKMVRIRAFESKVTQLFLKGLVPGTIHLSTGQEAVAAGATGCLRAGDRVMLTHRPHGQALAKGMDPKLLLAEILGREGGCCRGKGGSMHLADPQVGIMPSYSRSRDPGSGGNRFRLQAGRIGRGGHGILRGWGHQYRRFS